MASTAEANTRALIRAMQAGQPLNGITAADCGEWRDIMSEVARAYGPDNNTTAAMRIIDNDSALLRLASEGQPPADPWQTFDLLPDLPVYARLTPTQERQALESNIYLNTYVDYARAITPMLPDDFHESAALHLGAVAIARRLCLNMPHATVYPNLYLLWIAVTTIFNKSTGLTTARRLIEQVMPHLRLTSEFSREALLDSLAGRDAINQNELGFENDHTRFQLAKKFAARRAIILDEASSLFAGLKREHNTGMTELLMYLYDCSDYERATRTGGMVIVKKPYLNFLGATTPVMLKQADNTRLWHSGLWPRFGLLLPRTMPTRLIRVTHHPTEPPLLTTQLDKLTNHYLPIPESPFDFPDARSLTLSSEIFGWFNEYHRALVEGILLSDNKPPLELFGSYGRLATAALKVAIILAALDWDGTGNAPIVEPAHWFRAQMIAENWREGAHLFYRAQNEAADLDSLEQQILGAVLRHIAKHGECNRRDVYRNLSKKPEQVHPVIDSMIQAGLLKEKNPEGRRKFILEPGEGLPPAFVSKS